MTVRAVADLESPLPAIRDLEKSSEERLTAARARAGVMVTEARDAADALVASARRIAMADADRAYRAEIERARHDAEEIDRNVRTGIESFMAAATNAIDEAAEAVLRFVLPAPPSEGGD